MYINKREYEVAKQLGRVIHSKVYLLNFKLQRVAEISGVVLDGASFTNDATSDIRRTCSISIVPTDSSFDLLSGDMDEVSDYYASNTKIWLDKYFQVFIGLEDKDNDNKIEYTNMGIYLIDNPTQAYSAEDNTLTINGVDMMAKLTGLRNGQLEGIPYQIPKDSDIQDVVISALNEAKIPKYNVPKPSFINPSNVDECPMEIDIGIGDTVYGLISKLAEINSNFQMYFDVNGVFNYNMIPSGHNEPTMVTDDIWQRVLISYAKSIDYENVKNVIEVYGKTADNGKTPIGYAWDNNPYSPFYVGYLKGYPNDPDYSWSADNYVDMLQHAPNIIRQVCNGGEYDNIQIIEGSSINLAQDRAEYELYLRCKLQDQIEIECVPLYWLDTNWLVSITLPNKLRTDQEPEKYIIKSITTTLGTDSSQSITMMKYYPLYDFEIWNEDPNPIVQPIVEDDPREEDDPIPTEPTNPSSGGNNNPSQGESGNPSQGGSGGSSNPSKGGNTKPSQGGSSSGSGSNPSKDNPSPTNPTNPSTGDNTETDPTIPKDPKEDKPKEEDEPIVVDTKCYGYTSGERFLMESLNNKLSLSTDKGLYGNAIIRLADDGVDKIQSLTAKVYKPQGAFVTLFGCDLKADDVLSDSEERTYVLDEHKSNIIGLQNDISENSVYCNITITSFTTTDGVLHTSDNINYEDDVNNPPLPIKPTPTINEIDGIKCYGYTTGERFLMNSLNNQLRFSRDSGNLSGKNNPISTIDLKDMSKIHSIKAKIYCNYEDEINLFGNKINNRYLVGVEEEYKIHKDTHSIVMKALSGENNGLSITITSFTTTDGVVHTLDNINYEDDVNNPPKEKEIPPIINEIDNVKCYGYTAGERFLMNILDNQLRLSSDESSIKPSAKIDVGDMSKIHSVNAKIYCNYEDKINLFGNEINKRFLVGVEEEYKIHKGSNSIEIEYLNDNRSGISITITSFTTTDGITHTLDNINYEDDMKG
jgi:hypothetical protein